MTFNIKRDRDYLTTAPTFEQGVTNIQTLLKLCPEGKEATFAIEDDGRQVVASVTNRRIEGVFTKQVLDEENQRDIHVADVHFDATDAVLLMPHEDLIALEDSDDSTDELGREHVAWDGPCYVRIVDEICAYFGVEEIDQITEEGLAFARKAANATPQREELITVSIPLRLRVAPGADVDQFIKDMTCAVLSRTDGIKVAHAGQPVILKAA
ncbi:hypothetical protein AB4Y45_35230 [Paraburkholderia sp. EG287A]|uniref:hypothetical protein n=1 Tax=Paraburkholderia sp. EG287A TaxID=3237012 RepID=UPI0034D2ECA4